MRNKKIMAAILAALLLISAIFPAAKAVDINGREYEMGTSTTQTGSLPIWVPAEYGDLEPGHWFYEDLNGWRLSGIVHGDDQGNANLDRQVTAKEMYTMLARYIFADAFEGQEINGGLLGDYEVQGQKAWINAYSVVAPAISNMAERLGVDIDIPENDESHLARKQTFVLYAMSVLTQTAEPEAYFQQFSGSKLGCWADNETKIVCTKHNRSVEHNYSETDSLNMTPSEIQSANMLMYLGVLDGTSRDQLSPDSVISRGESVKLLTTLKKESTAQEAKLDGAPGSGETTPSQLPTEGKVYSLAGEIEMYAPQHPATFTLTDAADPSNTYTSTVSHSGTGLWKLDFELPLTNDWEKLREKEFILTVEKPGQVLYTHTGIVLDKALVCAEHGPLYDDETKQFKLCSMIPLLAGDIDGDGKSHLTDYSIITTGFMNGSLEWSMEKDPNNEKSWAISTYNPESTAYAADLDGDGRIGTNDLSILNHSRNFRQGIPEYGYPDGLNWHKK